MSARERAEGVVGAEGLGELASLPGVPVASPADEAQAVELLRLAAADGLRLALCGAGSKLGWALSAGAPDLAISTRRLDGVVEFEPGDGVLTARAGARLAVLRDLVAAEGLELTPDVPRPERATLGGVVGAGQSGPDRLLHGPVRHHVLGTRSVQLSGATTRSGGRLVKNVSGYDAHRLLTGSHGCLALVLEASLRLGTAPERRLALAREHADLAAALEGAASLRASGVAPRALTVENVLGAGWRVHALLAGRAAHVAREAELASASLGGEVEVLEGAAAAARGDALRDLEPSGGARAALRLTAGPTRLRAALGELFDALPSPHEALLVVQPGVATADLELTGGEEALGELLPRLRAALRPLRATAQLRLPTPGEVDPLAESDTDPARLALQERLRATYDPHRLLTLRPPLGGLR
jgi:glycolate oxidase FAD binding subunit